MSESTGFNYELPWASDATYPWQQLVGWNRQRSVAGRGRTHFKL